MKYFVHKDIMKNERLIDRIFYYLEDEGRAPCSVNIQYNPDITRFDIDENAPIIDWDISNYLELIPMENGSYYFNTDYLKSEN